FRQFCRHISFVSILPIHLSYHSVDGLSCIVSANFIPTLLIVLVTLHQPIQYLLFRCLLALVFLRIYVVWCILALLVPFVLAYFHELHDVLLRQNDVHIHSWYLDFSISCI